MDTIGLYGSNWGVFDASISAIDFTAEENGNLTFVRLDANNYVELFSIDENGLTLWTETAIGLPPINGAIYDIDVFQGINNEYYVSVYSFGVEDVYKFESSTWSSMGFLNHDGRFDSSGRFTRFNMVEVTTPGLESRTYNFEYFDGVNWIQFESVTFSGLDGLLTKYTIDSNNKIYAMMDIPYAGGPFSIHQLELYTIQLGIATQLGNTLVVSFTSSAGNHAILLDRRENPHMFFSVYDLGWTSLNHISYSDSVFSGGEIHFGFPEHFQTPRGWPVAVDELNCLNLCYSYHTDFWNPTDSIKVEAKKICYCRFSPSENTLNVQLPQLISEISHPVNYQWLDCDNNFALIPGETDSIFTALVDGSYALQVELDGCIDTSECVVISGIGIDELSSIMVRIHPNPTSHQITIDLDEVIEGIMIFNLFGELVQEEASATFSVSTLSNGVYVMSIQTSNGILRSRFIKE